MVVPDDADISSIKAAARDFEAEEKKVGYDVTVEIKTGYGAPKPKEEETSESGDGADEG